MFAHVPIALGVQAVFAVLAAVFGLPLFPVLVLGALAASAVCIMREITQAEYRWIEASGNGLRANMAWYEGLLFWRWNRHSIDETVTAILAAILPPSITFAVAL